MRGKKIKKKEESSRPKEIIIRNCNVGKAVLVAILLTIVGFVIRAIETMLTMDYYMDPAYFTVWSRVMMPAAGPPPPEFTYLSLAFGFIIALVYIWAYKTVELALSSVDGWLRKGLLFGVLVFLIGVVPASLSLYLLINLPPGLLAWWTVSGLLIAFIDGIVIAKLC